MSRVIIIGGGAIGLSLAWQLSKRGADVALLERNQLTSGTTWHAAGIVGPLRATHAATRLAMAALTTLPALEEETGQATGFRQTGGFWLAREADRMDELHRIAALGRHMGLTPRIVDGAPDLDVITPGGICGALAVPEDGSVNPVDLSMAYAGAARAYGSDIREGVKATGIILEKGIATGVRLADGTTLTADHIAICAGAWTNTLLAPLGHAIPLQPVQHMYVVTEPMPDLPDPFPILRDLDRGLYIKGDTGKLVIGGFEPDAIPWDPSGPEASRPFLELAEDWDQFAPFMEAALALVPALAQTGIQHFMNGPESFTADSRPLIGPLPGIGNLYVAAGMNSTGVMSSAGIGTALAHWIADGQPPFDLWEMDVARADPLAATPQHMKTRMTEAVADVFALHWPYKQPKAGRDLRRSALHPGWQAAGAVFCVTASWERPLWFAKTEAEQRLPYSTGAQPWWPIAAREAQAMASSAALIDLTPFGKFDVTGPDALQNLQRLAVSNLDTAIGRATYTQFLNPKGGIEADLTVTRLSEDHFRLTSGAATRWKDHAWLRRHLTGKVSLNDVTEAEAVIGIMGPHARAALQALSGEDWGDFPFATARAVQIAGHPALATRLSYVGEAGWELSIPAELGPSVFAALREQVPNGLGHYALDGCRMEKGYRHWGHDLGPDITLPEAGLGFTIAWDKPDFIGKPALLAQREAGLTRRLTLLSAEDAPLLLHDEPVWAEGRVVGLTTSGARGPRTGVDLAFALIEDTAAELTIEVAGRRHRATRLKRPPYDPSGERMRQ